MIIQEVRPGGIAAVWTHFHTSGYYIYYDLFIKIDGPHLMTLTAEVVPSV